jgi:phosphoadenosine phosphosulfate reductase
MAFIADSGSRPAGEATTLGAAGHGLEARVAALVRTLRDAAHAHAPAALASSLSIEDMVVTDAILRNALDIEIFTLDTGRLHGDTVDTIAAIEARYGYAVRRFAPEPAAVAAYVARHGANALYESVALRKACCEVRKTEPLRRALAGKRSWITGLRREQAVTRGALEVRSFDANHGIEKFSPLVDWSEDDVWAYIRAFDVPYNRLYDQGYRSIGCAPCSRPTVAGEDVRAGRWWWEAPDSKECGLHVGPDGRLLRTKEDATA